MQPFHRLTSRVIPLLYNNVDTDQIIPARYLKVIDKSGLAEGLFYGWRYLSDGDLDPAFHLNHPEYQDAKILVAGDNFGCGSSREHAPWALTNWGFRAIISTSFADIFQNNSFKNGLLLVQVDAKTLEKVFELTQSDPKAQFSIDLFAEELSLPDGQTINFPVDAFNRTFLLEGLDQLGYLLKFEEYISTYEQSNVSY